MASSKVIHVGVLLTADTQFLDTACVDILGMLSREYLEIASGLPSTCPTVQIVYINGTADDGSDAGKGVMALTSGAKLLATHRISDPEVQAGKLDILFIPGPDPRSGFAEATLQFVRDHHANANTDVLSACGPRELQPALQAKYPKAKLVGDKYRWIQDGNLWSSGAITNGNDLMAAYCRTGKHFAVPLVDIACKMADVGDRPQEYGQDREVYNIEFAEKK
ncbi:unnamed protein product [Parascedosporium putredinis]|uniref:Uncharacterized protein n=1 Tax=Parascedosporium putredinis TaxID=1442378 RepID=A0A9P1H069_9PEZI|nr:unnamed protein product [Parascedosporium putredinis]CAI7992498.1 unnamed protein product [Parascedosporium putredinis]